MAKMKYKMSSRATILLGRESVSRVDGAIIELVKNTYDADAGFCCLCFDVEHDQIALEKETNDMVERIVEADVDAVIIDYKLSSQQSVSYSGVSLAKELNQRLWGFPIFVLTTYRDDLFDHELFDSYLVFDFARYIEDDKERIEFNSKLIEQIKKYRIEMANCKSELERLLPRAGESASIDARILELDSQLERSIYGDAAISLPIKKDFTAEKINELISKIDLLIEGE